MRERGVGRREGRRRCELARERERPFWQMLKSYIESSLFTEKNPLKPKEKAKYICIYSKGKPHAWDFPVVSPRLQLPRPSPLLSSSGRPSSSPSPPSLLAHPTISYIAPSSSLRRSRSFSVSSSRIPRSFLSLSIHRLETGLSRSLLPLPPPRLRSTLLYELLPSSPRLVSLFYTPLSSSLSTEGSSGPARSDGTFNPPSSFLPSLPFSLTLSLSISSP